MREVNQNPAYVTASELRKNHHDLLNTVSIRTIQHRLQDLLLLTRRVAKEAMVTEAMVTEAIKKKRVDLCKKYNDWTSEQWRQVMFSDENTF